MLESKVIEYCAPTLAGMKCASLFNFYFELKEHVIRELKRINFELNQKGVYVEPLLWKGKSVLIYAYRKSWVERILQQSDTRKLLLQYGYEECRLDSCLHCLKERLSKYDVFPHEIGVFLGYPLQDVIGFIENGGKNCKCCGLWKVYCNELEARKYFEKVKRCTAIYLKIFKEGKSIAQMTIQS